MRSYYALRATLRYYSHESLRTWIEPPHVFLANMPITERSILKFNRTYGQIGGTWEAEEPETREVADKSPRKKRSFYVIGDAGLQEVQRKQTLLRRAWTKDRAAFKTLWLGGSMADVVDASDPTSKIKVETIVTPAGIDLVAGDMWSFTRIAFLRDFVLGRVQVCLNPDCRAPYFLTSRKGQKYCTHQCAVLMNVRRFREREKRTAQSNSKEKTR